MKAVAIDVAGNSAVAKVEAAGKVGTISKCSPLLKFGGEWRVVSGAASV